MKNKTYTLNTILAVVLGAVLLVGVLLRAFLPRLILPRLDIPNMALLSLIVLVLDHYLAKDAKRCYICIPVFSLLSFGLLPYAACFVGALEGLKLGIIGCVVFTALTWLYSSVQDRLSSGPATKAAPIISAIGLYLAVQCFAGLLV